MLGKYEILFLVIMKQMVDLGNFMKGDKAQHENILTNARHVVFVVDFYL